MGNNQKKDIENKISENIFDKIKNHPFLIFISISMAGITGTSGFFMFLYKEQVQITESKYSARLEEVTKKSSIFQAQLNAKIEELKNKLSKTKIDCQSDLSKVKEEYQLKLSKVRIDFHDTNKDKTGLKQKKFFNLSRIFISKSNQNNGVSAPLNTNYFKKDRFFAYQTLNEWKYEYISELDYLKLLNKEALLNVEDSLKEQMAQTKMHLWRSNDTKKIQNVEGITTYFSHIYVQKVPIKQLLATQNIDHIVELLLTNQLILEFKTVSQNSNVSYNLLNLQKKMEILHFKSITTLKRIKINGNKEDEYYIRKQLIIVPSIGSKSIYMIAIIIPTSKYVTTGKDFAITNDWLINFRILE